MRILFVDDDPDICHLYRLFFAKQGHLAHVASNGRDAVMAVRSKEFNVIVMDVAMPEMNGWEAARQIRQLDHGHKVPLILLSGYNAEEDHQKAKEVGADTLLSKPILPEELLQHLLAYNGQQVGSLTK